MLPGKNSAPATTASRSGRTEMRMQTSLSLGLLRSVSPLLHGTQTRKARPAGEPSYSGTQPIERGAYWTMMRPSIHGCGVQLKLNVPAVLKGTEAVGPDEMSPVSKLPSAAVAVWITEPSFFQVSVVPTAI